MRWLINEFKDLFSVVEAEFHQINEDRLASGDHISKTALVRMRMIHTWLHDSNIPRPGSQVGIEPRSRSAILGLGSQVGIEPRSWSTILGPSTILGAERWLQSLLRIALCSSPS